MKLTVNRDMLLKPLQVVAGVIERRQTMPVLSNVLLKLKDSELYLTGTDLEIELQAKLAVTNSIEEGTITVPAKKVVDICRALPDQSEIEMSYDGVKLIVRCGRSRFSLVTLPAHDFPHTEEKPAELEFSIKQSELRTLIENTHFAMAQQDIRYYLNGMLLEASDNSLRAVATDGHRLAFSSTTGPSVQKQLQIIVPRKGVLELSRLLTEDDGNADILINTNQIRVKTANYIFTTKLIDGRYPDYHKVIPKDGNKVLLLDRDTLRQSLSRVAVLTSEKNHGLSFELKSGVLRFFANNPEQEEAEEELSVDYAGDQLETAFNVAYLLDALSALPAGIIKLTLGTASGSMRIESNEATDRIYVVMPMRL